jgi:hypothetical protein
MSSNAESQNSKGSFILKDVMSSVSQKMQLDFAQLTAQITHKPSKGTAREEIVRRFLEERLPESLEMGAGEVVDTTGQRSAQMDLVVFDRLHCPRLVQVGDIRVYPVEGVQAVIQVKSKIDMPGLRDSVENIRSAKRLMKSAFYKPTRVMDHWTQYGKTYDYFPMTGYVFAFESIDIEALGKGLDELNRESAIPPEQQIDLVCLLDKGVIAHNDADGNMVSWAEPTNPDTGETTVTTVRTRRSLLLFYVMIHDQLSIAKMRPVQMVKYIPQTFLFGDDEE